MDESKMKIMRRFGYAVLGVIIFIILSFLTLIGYYLWNIKFGLAEKKEQIAAEFSSQLTVSPLARSREERVITEKERTAAIRPNNPRIGGDTAPVTIIVFSGFQCYFSQQAYSVFKEVMEQYGPAIQVVFKQFPIEQIHPQSRSSALASLCAHEQDSFLPYYDLLFERKALDDASLLAYAKELQLDMAKFSACITSKKYDATIEQDLNDGLALGVRGTPTYIVNDQKIEGAISREVWNKVIIDALQKK